MDTIEQKMMEYEKEKQKLLAEKEAMAKQIEKLIIMAAQPKQTVIENQTNNNNTFHIKINNFGQESTEYITEKLIAKLIQTPVNAIPNLIKHLHFHPDHPENCNVRITNHREKFARVFQNESWELARKVDVVNSMVDSGFNMLDTYYESNPKEDTKSEKYQKFQEQMDRENSKTRKRVCEDTEIVVLNESMKDGK
jgi:hypothetical protein